MTAGGAVIRAFAVILRDPAESQLPVNPLRHRYAIRRLIGVVLLALLLGQWTVLAHSIAHARAPAAIALSDESDDAWGHHAGTPACHLIDHLLAGQAPGVEAASVPGLPPTDSRVAALAPSIGPGAASRAYEARGPPRA